MTERLTISRSSLEALRQAMRGLEASVESEIVVTAPEPSPKPAPLPPAGQDASFAFKDYGAFYDALRQNYMLGPVISAPEFEGCDTIIRACAVAGWGVSWVAYALATAYHETAHTMQPVKEYGGNAYYTRMYDIKGNRPAKARELGNLQPGDGARFAGRGYVQLTGRSNYKKATDKLRAMGLDIDLVADPDSAMKPAVAAAILVSGMREGWFTGRDIDDDLPERGPATADAFKDSRDIINGKDKQAQIATYAIDFQTCLLVGGYDV